MGILSELESIKYRPVFDLIKNDESYDKKRNTMKAIEVFQILHKRFQKMLDILTPLMEKLGHNVEIIDFDFAQGMQEYMDLTIRYVKDEKQYFLSIINFGFNQFEVIDSGNHIDNLVFVQNNKKLFINIFKGIIEYSIDDRIRLLSTSKKFILCDIGDSFSISDSDEKMFSLLRKHSLYEKNILPYDFNKKICNYTKLNELLDENNNIQAIYQHLNVYEENVENVLSKKLIKY